MMSELVLDLSANEDVLVLPENSTNKYECKCLVFPEEGGGYYVEAWNLAGVYSQGDTVEEALSSVKEAFAMMIQDYLESNEEISWIDRPEEEMLSQGEYLERWVVVDA